MPDNQWIETNAILQPFNQPRTRPDEEQTSGTAPLMEDFQEGATIKFSAVRGGSTNTSNVDHTIIAGSVNNPVDQPGATVGGENQNIANGTAAVVGSGASKIASNSQFTMSGSLGNLVIGGVRIISVVDDFHDAYGIGEDPKHISNIDADGISLAAIQGVTWLILEKDQQISDLETQVSILEKRTGRLMILLMVSLFLISLVMISQLPFQSPDLSLDPPNI